MSFYEGLLQTLGGGAISNLSQQLGADQNQTQTAIQAALPLLISALANNASSQDGAMSLAGALDKDHDGSILNDLAGFIPNASSGAGAGILKHLFGGNDSPVQQNVQQGIAQASGLNMGQVSQLLITLAPIVMGFLGKQKQSEGLDISSLAGLLMNTKTQAQSQASSGGLGMLANLLDQNRDGNVMDDAMGLLGNLLK